MEWRFICYKLIVFASIIWSRCLFFLVIVVKINVLSFLYEV